MEVKHMNNNWNLFVKFSADGKWRQKEVQKEIRAKALKLCKEFLPGAWKDCTLDEFELSKMSGGFRNLMFRCSLKRNVEGSEPSDVLIKLQVESCAHKLVREAIVISRLADIGFGPQLFGTFEGGRIDEYIPSRILTHQEFRSPGMICHLSASLCQAHSLDMPIPYVSSSIQDMWDWLESYEEQNGNGLIELKPVALDVTPDMYPSQLSLEDLKTEVRLLEKRLKEHGGPLVFCHKDLVAQNVLLREGFEVLEDGTVLKDGLPTEDDPLVLIDYESCGYEYRGFELGSHVAEYGNELGTKEWPYYIMDYSLITMERMQLFCEGYLDKAYKLGMHLSNEYHLTGNRELDFETLYKETSDFREAGALYMGVYWLLNADRSSFSGLDVKARKHDKLISYFYFKNLRLRNNNDC